MTTSRANKRWGIHTKRGGEFRRAQRLHNQGLAESIIMCTTDQTCDCWDNGYAHCLGQLKTWASGTHGRNCDCDGCVVAVIILKNALQRVGTILDELQETPPEPPKPSDQFDAPEAERPVRRRRICGLLTPHQAHRAEAFPGKR